MKHELEMNGDDLILITRDYENNLYTGSVIESNEEKEIDCTSNVKKRLINLMQFNEMILNHRSENAENK